MKRALLRGCMGLLIWTGCGGDAGPSGPALEVRPETQTCLSGMSEMPRLLSDTSCFSDLEALEPGPDLIPYQVNSALWTDGAFKLRYMVIPPTSHITMRDDGSWKFPDGSILIKMFGFEFQAGDPSSRRAVETRFMVLRDEKWEFTTYRWNGGGTEAELLNELLEVIYTLDDHGEAKQLDYLFPDEDACVTCHGVREARVLGPKTSQLNRDHDYDGVVENQLVAMDEIGLFGEDVLIDPSSLPRMADPQSLRGSLGAQARAYLEANCAHCHQPGGWAPPDTELDLRYETPLADTGLCGPMKFFDWEGIQRVAPGDAAGSGVLQRFVLEDVLRMPSIGSSTVDPLGTELITAWIRQLHTCP